jgi:2-polyprenyl-6-hydroxyphenyl methylase/3-demethylubiquinone-9 3-methyltransferase
MMLLRLLNMLRNRKYARGMSVRHDLVDWLGGYPFEVSTPGEIFDYFKARGYQLRKIKTVGGRMGCNEFVFQRQA